MSKFVQSFSIFVLFIYLFIYLFFVNGIYLFITFESFITDVCLFISTLGISAYVMCLSPSRLDKKNETNQF